MISPGLDRLKTILVGHDLAPHWHTVGPKPGV
jgi:hypothetical protein